MEKKKVKSYNEERGTWTTVEQYGEPKTLYRKDKEPTLKEMQKFVGGYIEVVQAKNGDDIILNEEGRIFGYPVNHEASEHWLGVGQYDDVEGFEGRNIVGNAMILSGKAKLK